MVVWIEVQPANILVQFKRKNWSWADHVMCSANNRNATGIGEWMPREGRCSWGWQRIRCQLIWNEQLGILQWTWNRLMMTKRVPAKIQLLECAKRSTMNTMMKPALWVQYLRALALQVHALSGWHSVFYGTEMNWSRLLMSAMQHCVPLCLLYCAFCNHSHTILDALL